MSGTLFIHLQMPDPEKNRDPEPRNNDEGMFVSMPSPFAGMSFQITVGPGQAEPLLSEIIGPSLLSQIGSIEVSIPAQPAECSENRFSTLSPQSWEDLGPGDVLRLPGCHLLLTCRPGRDTNSLEFVRISHDIPPGFERFGFGALSRATFRPELVEVSIAPRCDVSFDAIGSALSRMPFERREAVVANVLALLEANPARRLSGELYVRADGIGASQLSNLVLRRPGGLLSDPPAAGSDIPITFVYRSASSAADHEISGFFETSNPDLSLVTGQAPYASFTFDTLNGIDEDADDERWETAYGADEPPHVGGELSSREAYDLEIACRIASRFLKVFAHRPPA